MGYPNMGATAPGMMQMSPSAFAAPGLNPQTLATLMMMQNRAAGTAPPPGGAPMMPAAPGAAQNAPQPGAIPAVPQPQNSNLLAQLAALNPNLMKGAPATGKPGAMPPPSAYGLGAGWGNIAPGAFGSGWPGSTA